MYVMATLAAPGFYALPDAPIVSATAAFTGAAFTMPLYSPLLREYAVQIGIAPESMLPMPGQTRLAGNFGARRGRRFLNEVTR